MKGKRKYVQEAMREGGREGEMGNKMEGKRRDGGSEVQLGRVAVTTREARPEVLFVPPQERRNGRKGSP